MDADLDPRNRTLCQDRPAEDRAGAGAESAAGGDRPKISDAELVTLAVMQALLGFTSEARWLRFAADHLRHLFPSCPSSRGTTSGYVGWRPPSAG